jgi:histidyl-tRNA synthetase
LESLGLSRKRTGYTEVLVLNLEEGYGPRYQAVARLFRLAGLACEVFPERRKLAGQFAYAERKGIAFAVLLGSAETAKGVVAVKDLKARQTVEVGSPDAAVDLVRERLAAR